MGILSIAAAGSDEYTRLYNIRKYRKQSPSTDYGEPTDYFCPGHLIGNDRLGISSLAFSNQKELLVSYNGENIYLFAKDMGLGPDPAPASPLDSLLNMKVDDINGPQVYVGHKNCVTVKGVSFFGSKCEYVVSGSDCERIFIWKKKGGEVVRVMVGDKYVVNCIEAHLYATILASSAIENDVKIWTPVALDTTLPSDSKRPRLASLLT